MSFDLERLSFTYDKENKQDIIDLWQECFSDSQGFCDYYFENVFPKSKVLSVYDDDLLVGMIHFNPYKIIINCEEINAYYVVGVAVKEGYRQKGIMKRMLQRGIEDMHKGDVDFFFLMPKNEDYYKGFGFERVYDTVVVEYNLDVDRVFSQSDDIYFEELNFNNDGWIEEINEYLSLNYNFYTVRDRNYYENMLLEHRCQDGEVVFVRDKEQRLIGIFAYDVYGEDMYIDRILVMNKDKWQQIIHGIIRMAYNSGGKKLTITLPGMDEISYQFEGIVNTVKAGYGIMVYSPNKEYDISDIRGKTFVDEIV